MDTMQLARWLHRHGLDKYLPHNPLLETAWKMHHEDVADELRIEFTKPADDAETQAVCPTRRAYPLSRREQAVGKSSQNLPAPITGAAIVSALRAKPEYRRGRIHAPKPDYSTLKEKRGLKSLLAILRYYYE